MRLFKVEKDFIVDGYRCVIVGQSIGHRCGYVGIPKGHELYGKHYDDIEIRVHGGFTYAGDGEVTSYPVESDLWWIGFDCAHSGDGRDLDLIKELASEQEYLLMLDLEKKFPTRQWETVRTIEYVEQELIDAVKQLSILKEVDRIVKEFEIELELEDKANERLKKDEGVRYSKEDIIKEHNLDKDRIEKLSKDIDLEIE